MEEVRDLSETEKRIERINSAIHTLVAIYPHFAVVQGLYADWLDLMKEAQDEQDDVS